MKPGTKGGLLWPTLCVAAGVAALAALGTWQMQRLAWKEGLIAQIAARAQAAPIALAEASRRVGRGEDLEYTRVTARGRFVAGREAYVWAPAASGPGWHVYAALETADGAILVVNRGFVAEAYRNPVTRPEPAGAERELVGLLRRPEVPSAFAAKADVARRLWYWRDLDGMARAMLGEARDKAMPFFLDAEATPALPAAGGQPHIPRGGATRLEIPNRHLEYALTWYGLALTLVGVYAAMVWSRRQATPVPGATTRA